MKKRISDVARVEPMLEAIRQIGEFTKDVSYDVYKQDLKLKLAIIRLIEIIGEAANHVSDETKNTFVEIEWTLLNRVCNLLIHEYFGVDYDIIWDSVQKDIPLLETKLETIRKTLDTEL